MRSQTTNSFPIEKTFQKDAVNTDEDKMIALVRMKVRDKGRCLKKGRKKGL
jgi:hypothetical protein